MNNAPSTLPESGKIIKSKFAMFRINRRRLILGGVITLVLAIALVSYEVILPNRYGDGYLAKMSKRSAELQSSLQSVADGTTRQIYTSATSDAQANKADIGIIEKGLAQSDTALANFESTSSSLSSLPLSGFFGSYTHAKTVEDKAKSVAGEIHKRLDTYNILVRYLDATNKIDQKYIGVSQELSSVEASIDADKAIATFRHVAGELRQYAAEYEKVSAPDPLKETASDNINFSRQLADAFDAFANASDAGDLSALTTAAKSIDDVQTKLTDFSKSVTEKFSQDGPVMRPVVQLPSLVSQLNLG